MNNTNLTEFADQHLLPQPAIVLQAIILIPLSYAGIFGNILVIYLIYHHKPFHTSSYYLLTSLAISDITFLANPVQQKILNVLSLHLRGVQVTVDGVFCKIVGQVTTVSLLMNAISMVMIAMNRYTLILHPKKYEKIFSIRKTNIYIYLGWFVSSLSFIMLHRYQAYTPEVFACSPNPRLQTGASVYFMPTLLITSQPVIATCYIFILKKMRSSKKKVAAAASSPTSHSRHIFVEESAITTGSLEKSTSQTPAPATFSFRIFANRIKNLFVKQSTVPAVDDMNRVELQQPGGDSGTTTSGISKVEITVMVQFGVICLIFFLSWGLYGLSHFMIWMKVGRVEDYPWMFYSYMVPLNSAINPLIYATFNHSMRG